MFSEDLFLSGPTARRLYNDYARHLPIIDYHCHLQPAEILANKRFENLGEMWLAYDHYKWRAMRTFGIDERLITGGAGFEEKFRAFAAILPRLAGNPLFVWCQLELKRTFGIDEPLNAANAADIFARTRRLIEEKNMTPRYLIERANVTFIGTTDDPTDDLAHHAALQTDRTLKTIVSPSFRPDRAQSAEAPGFAAYIGALSAVSGVSVSSFNDIIRALENRLLFFKNMGSRINDNGMGELRWADATVYELDEIVDKALRSKTLTQAEADKYRSAFLLETGKLYHKHGFVMQLHMGAYRNANSAMLKTLGPDSGFDCAADGTPIRGLGALLDRLNDAGALPRTILYPLSMGQIENMAILAAAFCGEGVRARVALGAPWWFGDQACGIRRQLDSVGNLYASSLMAGMLTDSRSFLSYSRHELFRRVLCDWLGALMDRGEYFAAEEDIKAVIENICHNNAKEYFGL